MKKRLTEEQIIGVLNEAEAGVNLAMFFGRMAPSQLTTQHGYQYLEDRAAAGAPIKANKEISQFSVICHYGVRWGLLAAKPFIRPAAITSKLAKRDADAYDFAAHANPATTHRHYDRRRVKRASATE
ncbi:hypothetical protein [Achromobacter xylosoxidans]|uniref:hypothetical protein n=1 Tax=Alcaligenes xylosoxydans xylosoxydans TaxID=85698 RepID=UPI001F131DEA|nr:hypothetical protein [Achromobacter xylosoxidans]